MTLMDSNEDLLEEPSRLRTENVMSTSHVLQYVTHWKCHLVRIRKKRLLGLYGGSQNLLLMQHLVLDLFSRHPRNDSQPLTCLLAYGIVLNYGRIKASTRLLGLYSRILIWLCHCDGRLGFNIVSFTILLISLWPLHFICFCSP